MPLPLAPVAPAGAWKKPWHKKPWKHPPDPGTIIYNVPAPFPVFYDYTVPVDYVYTDYVPAEPCPDPNEIRQLLFATRGRMVPELARRLCLLRYCQERYMVPGTLVPEAPYVCPQSGSQNYFW